MSPLEIDLRWFLDDLCVEWGYCIPPDAIDEIARRPYLTAEEFACAVLEAEEMNPEHNKQAFRAIRDRFADKFGKAVWADEYGIFP